ncbi:MAG: hypothetical protein HS117_18120 [Verrucomicrobiaceae bacterium]|nr:hypothetical protein [Verrucomicrobiaceae bacterium]
MSFIALILSLFALLFSKAADFLTTIQHVGMNGESNPFARKCFDRFGFKGGLMVVALVWTFIVAVTYSYAWLTDGVATRWVTAVVGGGIAWVQWDAARFNRTGRTSWLTRQALFLYCRWTQRWRGR